MFPKEREKKTEIFRWSIINYYAVSVLPGISKAIHLGGGAIKQIDGSYCHSKQTVNCNKHFFISKI